MGVRDRIAAQLDGLDPFVLAHHPRCDYYADHTFELRGHDLCMGCFLVYPIGIASLVVLSALHLALPAMRALDVAVIYGVAAAFVAPILAYKALYRRGSRWLYEFIYRWSDHRLRMATKASLAVGLAWLAYPVVFRPSVRLPGAVLLVGGLVVYNGYKGLTALDECDACPEQPSFPDCTGMNRID